MLYQYLQVFDCPMFGFADCNSLQLHVNAVNIKPDLTDCLTEVLFQNEITHLLYKPC